jgi:phosphoribosylaminoimidazole-succinocarboxamide synthase
MAEALMETRLDLPNRRSGKVRDLYDVTLANGEPALLIVATDRISAFDVVMANGLPGKGVLLTRISKFWFDLIGTDVPHHLLSTEPEDVPGLAPADRDLVRGRMMLCRRTAVVPIECIARGYLAGSGWKEYSQSGAVCGIPLPGGLKNGDRLPEPLFTPSTKAASGHDQNIDFAEGVRQVGLETMTWLRDTTLALYARARAHAGARGIILADTKFEFGVPAGARTPILVDEILTPDSSRFWPADQWRPGGDQPSFDKQFVRDYLETLVAAGKWNKTPPGPRLPDDVVERSLARYREALERLTGPGIRAPAGA